MSLTECITGIRKLIMIQNLSWHLFNGFKSLYFHFTANPSFKILSEDENPIVTKVKDVKYKSSVGSTQAKDTSIINRRRRKSFLNLLFHNKLLLIIYLV